MTSAPPSDPLIGQLIDDRYQVRSRIARGGMATVYLATDLRLERRVAVKIMHSHLADDSNFKLRFVQEARSTARLAHPNVVSVFDQGQDADMAYLVMEYLPGITLRELLRDYKKLTPEQTIDIMDSVLAGLAAAHRAGIVHRDIKPENVLLADDGRIKLGDFGLARAASQATGSGQALLGTIAYLSPELLTRGVADARSDIYAIGIMMYEMLTGQQPFRGDQPMQIAYQHANDQVPAPSRLNPAVPPALDELVLWATTRDPAQRPKDASQLLEALRDAEADARHHDLTTELSPGGSIATNTHKRPTEGGADPAPYAEDAEPTEVFSEQNASLVAPRTTAGRWRGRSPVPAPITPARGDVGTSAETAIVTKTAKPRRHRLRGWLILILVVILAAGAGVGGWSYWYYSSGPGELMAVPHVIGKTEAAAREALSDNTFEAVPENQYSLKVPAGTVIASNPTEGTELHKGEKVKLTISQGPKPVTIPPLAGASQTDATNALTSRGDTVAPNPAQQFSDTVAKGMVISASRVSDKKDFSQGGPAFQGQSFSLVVSAGSVPDVVGQQFSDAQQTLQAVGLNPVQGEKGYNGNYASGEVTMASPQNPPNTPVTPGTTVILDVSLGPPPVPVPNVVGQTLPAAVAALKAQGFNASYPSHIGPGGVVPVAGFESLMHVTSQSPTAGTAEQKGTTVTLVISLSASG